MDSLRLQEISVNDVDHIGLSRVAPLKFHDSRGSMKILFESAEPLTLSGFSMKESESLKGAARGLHYQPHNTAPQAKLIEVVDGEIMDFVVDMNAPELMYCFTVSGETDACVYIPENFAHGFIALSNVRFRYLCFGGYSEKHERTVNALDSAAMLLGINNITLSDKDRSSPLVDCSFSL